MIRIKLPFQIKIYLLILILFLVVFNITSYEINKIVSTQVLQSNTQEFESLRSLFYNLLRLKIRSLESEAVLLADQVDIKQTLESWNKGGGYSRFRLSKLPISDRRDLIFVMDTQGQILDGTLRLQDGDAKETILDPKEMKNIFNVDWILQDVFFGYRSARYIRVERNKKEFFFCMVSVPVISKTSPIRVIGSVTLGVPVNQNLLQEIRAGVNFSIAFIFGDQVVATSFDKKQSIDLRLAWNTLPDEEQMALLNEPRIITLYNNERFLACASPLPLEEKGQGLYVILTSLENTFRFMDMIKRSILLVSGGVLCVFLLIAYFISAGVASPVRFLVNAISRIANGEYDVVARIKTGDELEVLGEEITTMVLSLKKRDHEIKGYIKQIEFWNKELESRVSDRTKDLEEKNLRLRIISEELGRSYERVDDEMKVLGEMQMNLLPDQAIDFSGLKIRSYYSPCGRSGGDYYDVIKTGGSQVFILIADVSGHGAPAAFIMGITRSMAHVLIEKGSSPGEVLVSLSNVLLKSIRRGEFVTMFLARLDLKQQQMTYSVAGHLPPLLLRKPGKAVEELEVKQGLPLGIMENPNYEEVVIRIDCAFRLLLYTDGLVEAFNDMRESYSTERLTDLVLRCGDIESDLFLKLIQSDLEDFLERPLDTEPMKDDITLVIVDKDTAESFG